MAAAAFELCLNRGVTGSDRTFDALEAIVCGGLLIGILDALDAVIFFGTQGTSAVGVYQFVASGLLGPPAFAGGVPVALLGLLIHFVIAFVATAVYVVAVPYWPTLAQRPFVWGPMYGIGVYIVMNFVVLPLSAAPPSPLSAAAVLNGFIGHAVLVGLPVALIARRTRRSPLIS